MEFVIVACDYNQDPPMAILAGPYGVALSVPIHDYQRVRELLDLPELVCPEN